MSETRAYGLGFVAQLFRGVVDWGLIHPFPHAGDHPGGETYLDELGRDLVTLVDADRIDATGDYPAELRAELVARGHFSSRIPIEYGGRGVTLETYHRALELIAGHCRATFGWIVAHQGLGATAPLLLFGTAEQRTRYLPRIAGGAISALAVTEPDAGADVFRIATRATPRAGGREYVLDGDKLFITNAPDAELIAVLAECPADPAAPPPARYTLFLVERGMPGVSVAGRCSFMGLRGLSNGHLQLRGVVVPAANVLGAVGEGLPQAMRSLTMGWLSILALSAGVTRPLAAAVGAWAASRVQGGVAIGEHDLVADMLAEIAVGTFTLETLSELGAHIQARHPGEALLEIGLAKYLAGERSWRIVDHGMQIRGARGLETEASQRARGEPAFPMERIFRDLRVNRIWEFSSQALPTFLAIQLVQTDLGRSPATGGPAPFPSTHPRFGAAIAAVDAAAVRVGGAYAATAAKYSPFTGGQRAWTALMDAAAELLAVAAVLSRAASLDQRGELDAATAAVAELACLQAQMRIDDALSRVDAAASPLVTAAARALMHPPGR